MIDTIVEAIFEIRFSSGETAISELLPGILYQRLKTLNFKPELESMPFPEPPKELINLSRELAYLPYKRIKLSSKNFYVQFAHSALFLNHPQPYAGWKEFRELIDILVNTIKDSEIEHTVEAISLRYINLIPKASTLGLKEIQLELKLGDWQEKDFRSINLAIDVSDNELDINIQLIYPARVLLQHDVREGVLIDIKVSRVKPETSFVENIDYMHDVVKHIFFNKILREELKGIYGG